MLLKPWEIDIQMCFLFTCSYFMERNVWLHTESMQLHGYRRHFSTDMAVLRFFKSRNSDALWHTDIKNSHLKTAWGGEFERGRMYQLKHEVAWLDSNQKIARRSSADVTLQAAVGDDSLYCLLRSPHWGFWRVVVNHHIGQLSAS